MCPFYTVSNLKTSIDDFREGQVKLLFVASYFYEWHGLDLLLDEEAQATDQIQVELLGNAESADSVVRHTGAARLAKEDPIEAAAAEKILRDRTS